MPEETDVVLKSAPEVIPGESRIQEQLAAIKPVVAQANPGNDDDVDPVTKAKQLVVDNYNQHRNPKQVPAMTVDLVQVLWYTGSRGNFRAICEFPVVHGLRYEVSYNVRRKEAFIDVYKKISTLKLEDA
jgi:hypothetical protein